MKELSKKEKAVVSGGMGISLSGELPISSAAFQAVCGCVVVAWLCAVRKPRTSLGKTLAGMWVVATLPFAIHNHETYKKDRVVGWTIDKVRKLDQWRARH